jgi:predicted Rossmann-fold nucleotide-binding protein
VALDKLVKGLKIVGIMGGHSVLRNDTAYTDIARLGKLLTSAGYTVITGGGPGVMEAANLGAYMAEYPDGQFKQAIARLSQAPGYQDNPDKYVQAAYQVTREFPSKGTLSLAVPTWAYSTEPTGQFASHIAKYFANSIREDGLLAMGTYGMIFAPGSAGTLQEIFQDTAHNSYMTFHYRAAMVFFGKAFYTAPPSIVDVVKDHATKDQPGWEKFIGVCDTPEEALQFIKTHPPEVTAPPSPRHARLNSFLTNIQKVRT